MTGRSFWVSVLGYTFAVQWFASLRVQRFKRRETKEPRCKVGPWGTQKRYECTAEITEIRRAAESNGVGDYLRVERDWSSRVTISRGRGA
jgi:hypothetical protein